MIELSRTDMPIYLDLEDDCSLHCLPPVSFASSGVKTAADMEGLFQKPDYLPAGEPCYRFYRSIIEQDKAECFQATGYHYDLTVILPSPVHGECKKTSGHFHSMIPNSASAYAEIYEVILGTALYILMKVNDPSLPVQQQKIEDAYLVEVHEGERIVLPPLYGHASINIGEGPLVFSNIASSGNRSDYGPIRQRHGLCYYVAKDGGTISITKNPNYDQVPQPKVLRPQECADLGITFHTPLYRQFLAQPSRYFYVGNPVGFEDAISQQQGTMQTKEGYQL